MKQYSALLMIASAALASCGSMPPAFTPPVSGLKAEIQFKANSPVTNFRIMKLDGGPAGCSCSERPSRLVGILGNIAALVPGSGAGADKGKNLKSFAVQVPANGEEFRFASISAAYDVNHAGPYGYGTITNQYCTPHSSFIPLPDHKYEVVFDSNKNSCGFEVFEIDSGGDSKRLSTAKTYPNCVLAEEPNESVKNIFREYCSSHSELYH